MKEVIVTSVRKSLRPIVWIACAIVGTPLFAQATRDLASLSLDDLMNVEVTSVARKGEKLSDTAAAVFVITQDDIRKSGATSIPEILRIVPGLDVARVNGSVWAISARGSNGQFANKLLVMIDGRSVYTPLFSGVFWDAQDTLLEDVDRIEVIRGPGGTLWGANAVNGIINIITKNAIETQGGLVSVAGGAADGSSASARYGGSFGHKGNYRAYAKSFDRPASVSGVHATPDAWSGGRGGFRADWTSRRGDNFTAQGDFYRENQATLGLFDPDEPLADRASTNRVAGQDLQFSWSAVQSERSDTTLRASYDYTARTQRTYDLRRTAFDVDFQQHLKLGRHNDAVWGLGYRRTNDHAAGVALQLNRDANFENITSAFVQDEITVAPRFRVTVGTKIQDDFVLGMQLQPTLRALFKASERQTIWAAATSAVRTPSEVERYVSLNRDTFPDGTAQGGMIVLTGNPALKSERVEAYEIGYRWQSLANIGFDATAFHNHMHALVRTTPGNPTRNAAGRTIVPVNFANSGSGYASGAEFLVTDTVSTGWKVALGYAFYRANLDVSDRSSPEHQIQLRSSVDLPRNFEVDSAAYYVGPLANNVPGFVRLDTQLAWHATTKWEVSVSGENLLHARHAEFVGINGESELATPVQRTIHGKITWRF